MKKRAKYIIALCSLIAGLSLSTAAFAYGSQVIFSDKDKTQVVEPQTPIYEINENGQTFGGSKDAMYPDEFPDLMGVIGDHGIEGYIYSKELLDGPKTREEATAHSEAVRNGRYVPKSYLVYEADGKTVIDTFTERICQ